jgi:CheY-like chemotaxis protein
MLYLLTVADLTLGGMKMSEKAILVVDDDDSMVQALTIKLRDAGYKVLVAMDGLQAVMQAQKKEPDLVLLDIRMPAGSGLKVLERLKHSIKTRGIPVIVMTAMEEDGIRDRARIAGAVDFFKKPFDTGELLKAVVRSLGG